MSKSVKIALDAMGGDSGPAVVVPAALGMLDKNPDLEVILVGQTERIEPYLAGGSSRARIIDAREVVAMDDKPGEALRKKKDSSLRVAVNLVKENAADACVSAGNTGALMATSKFVLKTVAGIDRPAIMGAIPTVEGHTYMLDLGANADCNAENLFQFGVMGSVVASVIENIERPRVALLNIGAEEIKGNSTVREAAAMLSESDLNYVGFVEGDGVGRHKADVIVCDGFTGNVALKVMEGTASLVSHFIKKGSGIGLYGRFSGLISLPVLNGLRDSLDPRHYNGASLVGLTGIVVKSHGGADVVAFQQAIRVAMLEVEKRVPETIQNMLVVQEH